MDIQYTSDHLFHFVGHAVPGDHQKNFDTLKKVLSAGCVSHPPHENNHGTVGYKIDWDCSLSTEELIIPYVTCFADIPEKSLGIHIKKYGSFGVSFWKETLIMAGARPVMYIPMHPLDGLSATGGKIILKDLEAIYKGFNQQVSSKRDNSKAEWVKRGRSLGKEPENEDAAINAMENAFSKYFLAFIKPFDSQLGNDHQDNYYMEREWRKYGNLKFKSEDVCKIFVAHGFKDQMAKDFPVYAGKIEET